MAEISNDFNAESTRILDNKNHRTSGGRDEERTEYQDERDGRDDQMEDSRECCSSEYRDGAANDERRASEECPERSLDEIRAGKDEVSIRSMDRSIVAGILCKLEDFTSADGQRQRLQQDKFLKHAGELYVTVSTTSSDDEHSDDLSSLGIDRAVDKSASLESGESSVHGSDQESHPTNVSSWFDRFVGDSDSDSSSSCETSEALSQASSESSVDLNVHESSSMWQHVAKQVFNPIARYALLERSAGSKAEKKVRFSASTETWDDHSTRSVASPVFETNFGENSLLSTTDSSDSENGGAEKPQVAIFDITHKTKAEVAKLEGALSESKKIQDETARELNLANQKVEELKRLLRNESDEKARLKHKIAELDKIVQTSQAKLGKKCRAVRSLEKSLVSTQEATRTLTEEFSNLSLAFNDAKSEHDAVVHKLDCANQSLTMARREAKRRSRQAISVKEAIAKLEAERVSEKLEFTSKLNALELENAALKEKLQQAQKSEGEDKIVDSCDMTRAQRQAFQTLRALPSLYGTYKARSQFLRARAATSLIQATWRSHSTKRSFRFQLEKIVIVQSIARRWKAGRLKSARLLATAKIQSFYRRYQARRRFVQVKVAVSTAIEAAFRSCSTSPSFRSQTASIIIVQSIARRRAAYREVSRLKDARLVIAKLMQAYWRGLVARATYEKNLLVVKRDIVRMTSRKMHLEGRIQATLRGRVAMSVRRKIAAAQKIQATWRGFRCHVDYNAALFDILVVQKAARAWLARQTANALRQSNAPTTLQFQWSTESEMAPSMVTLSLDESTQISYWW